jgi:hypothetical protein
MPVNEKSSPVPLSATTCGPPDALVTMFRVAVRAPAAEGVKDTARPQLDPAPSDPEHWFCKEKSPAFGPASVMLLMASGVFPEFVSCSD